MSVDSEAALRPESHRASARLLVMLCTYNEHDNLQPLIEQIHEFVPRADIVVLDDNSPDGTGQLADRLASADSRIHVVHRPRKEGLGRATVAGFRYAIDHGYDLLINMDADFSHPPRYLPDLLARADRYDVVIGSRYVEGGGVVGWGPHRHFMSRSINWYARLMLGLRTKDNSGSFRCYRVSKLAEVPLDRIRSSGYAIQEEILYYCRQVGCSFTEVPILFEERRHGVSKISWKEAVSALSVLGRLRFQREGTGGPADPG